MLPTIPLYIPCPSPVLSVFQIVKFKNGACPASDGNMGTCFTEAECSSKGGTASGSCASGFGVCCICELKRSSHPVFLIIPLHTILSHVNSLCLNLSNIFSLYLISYNNFPFFSSHPIFFQFISYHPISSHFISLQPIYLHLSHLISSNLILSRHIYFNFTPI